MEKLNMNKQFYNNVELACINRSYGNKKAKRFTLFGTSQNVWIPDCYLEEDGTIKNNVNLDFIFKTNRVKRRVRKARKGIETLRENGGKKNKECNGE